VLQNDGLDNGNRLQYSKIPVVAGYICVNWPVDCTRSCGVGGGIGEEGERDEREIMGDVRVLIIEIKK
jgi:hypothetical protein